jgi:putative PIN family toxin of toxin-antitoxin system
MIVIIDANVAIAGVLSRGLCEAVMERCLTHHDIVLCEAVLGEIEGKLRNKLRVPGAIVAEYVQMLRSHATVLAPCEVPEHACRDPKDLPILGLVQPGQVDVIITGDTDLLVLGEYAGAKILSPRAFWELEREGS